MKKYKCVLFDLDHTLWDYETNSAEALRELYDQYNLSGKGVAHVDTFMKNFKQINTSLWDLLDTGKIHKDVIRLERFHKVFQSVGLDDYDLSLRFSADYLKVSPQKKNLLPNALETLDYLHKKYPLFIITNGFDEIQGTKISSSGITNYFRNVFTSEKVGHKKPEKEIFDHVLVKYGFRPTEAIMIGDNLLTDIAGAHNAAIDAVFFNPDKVSHTTKVNHEIADLAELKSIL
jgi:YjjG family noncanonical pyrimidine nucleotidase